MYTLKTIPRDIHLTTNVSKRGCHILGSLSVLDTITQLYRYDNPIVTSEKRFHIFKDNFGRGIGED